MKKNGLGIGRWYMILGVGFLLSGCAMQEDLLILNDKINTMNQRTGQVHKEISSIQEELDSVKKDLRNLDVVKSVDVIGRKQAEMGNQLENIRADLSRLQSGMEENDNQLQRLASDNSEVARLSQQMSQLQDATSRSETAGRDLAERNQKLFEQVNLLQAKVNELEKRINRAETVPAETRQTGQNNNSPADQKKVAAARSPKQDYEEAYELFKKDSFVQARDKFKAFLKNHPESEFSGNAQYWLAETYYQQERYEEAILEYEKVLSDRKNSNKVPSALLKQGMAFHSLGDAKMSRYLLEKLIKEYPKSDQAEMARASLKKWGK